MCGICGKVASNEGNTLYTVTKMNHCLFHRGPDDHDVMNVDDIAVFGHTRLSIIDLSSKARQPMQDQTTRYTITYNGEVYNYQELRKELCNVGYRFRSQSDTEVVLYAYIHWGARCFEKFNGMFALAIWDSVSRELVLARDKFGKKPLYYALSDKTLTFASELGALMEDDSIKNTVKISISALNHYLALGYILSPLTIYNEVNKLEPSTYLIFRDGAIIRKSRYWDYNKSFYIKTVEKEKEITERLEHELAQAVSRRLISDVPVGAFLSGGLDSSGIAAIASKYINYEFHTFSLGFHEKSYNEAPDAKLVSEHIGSIHHEILSNAGHDRRIVDSAIRSFDEPFSDTSLTAMYEVAGLASKHVKVALSGDGADEIFAGYTTYTADIVKRKLDLFPKPIRRQVAALFARAPIRTQNKMDLGFKLRQFAKGVTESYQYAHYVWRELFNEEERIQLIGRKHKDEIIQSHPFHQFKRYYDEVKDLDQVSQHLYVDAKTWLVDDILVKIDRSTMAFSLEARAPFLDYKFAEYAASIPSSLKVNKFTQKYILKKVLSKYLPANTLKKKKSGFNTPINIWFKNSSQNEFKFFNQYVLKQKEIACPL